MLKRGARRPASTPPSRGPKFKKMNRRAFLRHLIVGGGAALAVPCLSGPATASVAKPVTITYWYWADSPKIGQFFRNTIDRFNSSQGAVRVEADVLANTDTAKQKMVTTAAAGGGGPDVAYANTSFLQEFYTGGVLYPTQTYFDKWPDRADIPARVVEIHRIKSGQPMLYMPWAIQVDVHYYRTDLYAKAGLTAPTTFDDLVRNAQALTHAPDRYGFGLRAADQFGFLLNFCDYLLAQGVVFSDGKGGTTLDVPETVNFVNRLFSVYWDHVAQPSALQDRFPQMVAQFQAGKLAQWGASINHGPLLAGANNEYLDVLGVTVWPKGTTGKGYSNLASTGNIILKQSKNKDAAWDFITALMAPDVSMEFAKTVGFLPVRSSVAKESTFATLPWMRVGTESQPYYGTYPYWHKNWVRFSQTDGLRAWQQSLQRSISVDSLMKQLADLMRDV